jgi:hypothetical protein
MFPASEVTNPDESQNTVFETGFGQRVLLSDLSETKLQKFNQARSRIENEKEQFFKA